jgi:hypothetical protein
VSGDTSTACPLLLLLLLLSLGLLLPLLAGLLAGGVGVVLVAGSAAPVLPLFALCMMLSGTKMTEVGAWLLLSDWAAAWDSSSAREAASSMSPAAVGFIRHACCRCLALVRTAWVGMV